MKTRDEEKKGGVGQVCGGGGGDGAGSILGNQIVVHGGAVSESLTINPRGVGPLNNKHGDRGAP